jgi:uncharacterized protein YwqG
MRVLSFSAFVFFFFFDSRGFGCKVLIDSFIMCGMTSSTSLYNGAIFLQTLGFIFAFKSAKETRKVAKEHKMKMLFQIRVARNDDYDASNVL